MGVSTEFVGQIQTDKTTVTKVINGEVQLVYITPENVIDNLVYRNMLTSEQYKKKLVALVVDEAHCIKLWGDQFRKAFSKIGNLRSLIPSNVNVMALTATATTETYQCAIQCLSMTNPALIALSPDPGNIKYSVYPAVHIEELSELLFMELTDDSKPFVKTVVFVRKYSDCSDLYSILAHKLGSALTNPPGCPNISRYRRVEMFSRIMTPEKKDQVLSDFSSKSSNIELLITTSAFGLGVDCKNIRRVFHWGLPSTLEEYVQETGRVGRDGDIAEAILFSGKIGNFCERKIKEYQSNTTNCRRRILFQNFICFDINNTTITDGNCCDVCAKLSMEIC